MILSRPKRINVFTSTFSHVGPNCSSRRKRTRSTCDFQVPAEKLSKHGPVEKMHDAKSMQRVWAAAQLAPLAPPVKRGESLLLEDHYSVVQWLPFFWWLPHYKWSSPKRVPFFSRVTEQLRLKMDPTGLSLFEGTHYFLMFKRGAKGQRTVCGWK